MGRARHSLILKLLPAAWLVLSASAARGIEVVSPVPIGPVPAVLSAPLASAGAAPPRHWRCLRRALSRPPRCPSRWRCRPPRSALPPSRSSRKRRLSRPLNAPTALHSFSRASAQEHGDRADARLGALFDGIKPADPSAASPVAAAAPEAAAGVLDGLLRSESRWSSPMARTTTPASRERARGATSPIPSNPRGAAGRPRDRHPPDRRRVHHLPRPDVPRPGRATTRLRHSIQAFRRENPELARQKEGQWDFLLLDGVEHYRGGAAAATSNHRLAGSSIHSSASASSSRASSGRDSSRSRSTPTRRAVLPPRPAASRRARSPRAPSRCTWISRRSTISPAAFTACPTGIGSSAPGAPSASRISPGRRSGTCRRLSMARRRTTRPSSPCAIRASPRSSARPTRASR